MGFWNLVNKGWDAVKQPTMFRKVSYNKELSSPKCQLYQDRETLVCTESSANSLIKFIN